MNNSRDGNEIWAIQKEDQRIYIVIEKVFRIMRVALTETIKGWKDSREDKKALKEDNWIVSWWRWKWKGSDLRYFRYSLKNSLTNLLWYNGYNRNYTYNKNG